MRVARLLLIALLVAGCGAGAATAGPGQTSSTGGQPTTAPGGGGGGGGSGVLDAAKAAAAHAWSLVPTSFVAGIVPSPGPPQEELFPAQCSIFGDKVAIAFSLDVFGQLGATPADGQDISGFANRAYLEKLTTGNWTLWVALTPAMGVLFAEVNIQDGKDHTQDVVDLAKAILQQLGG
jgi:hypothetical protein